MRRMKRLLSVVLVFALAVGLFVPAGVFARETGVTINGAPVVFPGGQGPVLVEGRTLVPVRGVFEALEFNVRWDGATDTVTISNDEHVILITVGSPVFITNGTAHPLDVPAQNVGGRTMVPIRRPLESVGLNVRWDSGTVIITGEVRTTAEIDDNDDYNDNGDDNDYTGDDNDYTGGDNDYGYADNDNGDDNGQAPDPFAPLDLPDGFHVYTISWGEGERRARHTFEGYWVNGLPNGAGTLTHELFSEYDTVLYTRSVWVGYFVDGLVHGMVVSSGDYLGGYRRNFGPSTHEYYMGRLIIDGELNYDTGWGVFPWFQRLFEWGLPWFQRLFEQR